MNWLILGLGALATIANATQDEIRFRWKRLFGHWFKPGSKGEQWFNPSKSWTNKWFGKSKIVDFIFSTVLVFVTDFWHFLKFTVINSVFSIFLILLHLQLSTLEFIAALAFLNIAWGVIFEGFIRGIYGALSDKYME